MQSTSIFSKVALTWRCLWSGWTWPCFVFTILTLTSAVEADGLIFQLPMDGTYVEFQGVAKAEIIKIAPALEVEQQMSSAEIGKLASAAGVGQEQRFKQTVILSSVGRLMRGGQPCRWIETAWTMEPVGKSGDSNQKNTHILKALIPEKFLQRGADPTRPHYSRLLES